MGMSLTHTLTAAALAAAALLTAVPANAQPLEDDQGWSCVDDGNRVCGPGNSEGKPAACYYDGGVIVALWPCEAWTPSDGYRHDDGSVTYPVSGYRTGPAKPCTATQPCLTPQYCPDTGKFVVGYAPCPSLVVGPYAPGGLQPND